MLSFASHLFRFYSLYYYTQSVNLEALAGCDATKAVTLQGDAQSARRVDRVWLPKILTSCYSSTDNGLHLSFIFRTHQSVSLDHLLVDSSSLKTSESQAGPAGSTPCAPFISPTYPSCQAHRARRGRPRPAALPSFRVATHHRRDWRRQSRRLGTALSTPHSSSTNPPGFLSSAVVPLLHRRRRHWPGASP